MSCVSFSTLQTAETTERGALDVGVGGSAIFIEEGLLSVHPEVGARFGVANNFDLGVKYILPGQYYADAKLRVINSKYDVSLVCGYSFFQIGETGEAKTDINSAWHPMIIAGDDHWYIAYKRIFLNTEEDVNIGFLQTNKYNKWYSSNLIAGYELGDGPLRLMGELNIIWIDGDNLVLVPGASLKLLLD